ncbi:hypothetical protein MMC20_005351 [Loxospora ochrophaea]|nr:hypothetical protein [Loxospora ochrophaea]
MARLFARTMTMPNAPQSIPRYCPGFGSNEFAIPTATGSVSDNGGSGNSGSSGSSDSGNSVSSSSSSHLSIGIIVVIAIFAGGFVLTVVGIIIYCVVHNRKKRQNRMNHPMGFDGRSHVAWDMQSQTTFTRPPPSNAGASGISAWNNGVQPGPPPPPSESGFSGSYSNSRY